jgi:hypothetical protein
MALKVVNLCHYSDGGESVKNSRSYVPAPSASKRYSPACPSVVYITRQTKKENDCSISIKALNLEVDDFF